jgi:hypothetical protein
VPSLPFDFCLCCQFGAMKRDETGLLLFSAESSCPAFRSCPFRLAFESVSLMVETSGESKCRLRFVFLEWTSHPLTLL